MKKRNKNLYFSNRSEKPKKRIDPLIIRSVAIISAVLVISIIIAVITGIWLGKKSEQIPDDSETRPEDESSERSVDVPDVHASCVSAALPFPDSDEGTTVSVTVKNKDGQILFRSAVAHALGLQSDDGVPSPSEMVAAAREKGIRLSLCFCFSCFEIQDENTRSSILDFEKALVWELLSSIPDELILIGLPFDADGAKESQLLLKEISARAGGTAIGLACPYQALEISAAELLHLYSVADFLLLDLNGCSGPREQYVSDGEDSFVLTPNLNSAYQVYKNHYETIVSCNMRILLLKDMSEEFSDLISLGMNNYQLTDYTT